MKPSRVFRLSRMPSNFHFVELAQLMIPITSPPSRVLKKASCRLLKKIQMRGARKIDERRRTYSTLQRGD
jgi:hypothetical protein